MTRKVQYQSKQYDTLIKLGWKVQYVAFNVAVLVK